MKARRFVLLGNLLLGGLLMLVVWALLVWVASRPALKALIDLTPQRINTVDPVTEELLKDLRRQQAAIDFHLLLPPIEGQGADQAQQQALVIRQRLRDLTELLLKRYQYLGGESVVIHHYDFYRDAQTTRDAAQKYDYKVAEGEVLVVSVQMPGKEPRFRKLSLVSDLAVIDLPNSGPTAGPVPKVSVPVLKDFKGEAAISSAIKSLLVQGVPVAYVLRDYSVAPGADRHAGTAMGYDSFFVALERAGFELRNLSLRGQGKVPADAALVLVLEPKQEISDRDAEALFAYVQQGGRLLLNYVWAGPVDDMNPTGGKLGELLGYELSTQPVFHLIPDGTGRAGGKGLDGNPGVGTLQLRLSRNHPTTLRLAEGGRSFEVGAAREVRERGRPQNVRREPLLQTYDQGWLGVPEGPDGFPSLRAPAIQLRPFEVGMALEVQPEAGAATRPGQVVVVAGHFAINQGMKAGFGDFAVNVCNWMAERRVLLDIEGSRYEAKFMQLQPQQLERVWWFLCVGVPGAFALLGLVVFFVRRRQ
ncbi:MAG: Gldg family protein [Planctomycetes bacterium]|jgi:hypothetical protein|nr:Gldg family protein [Planctomycetota bacterium]